MTLDPFGGQLLSQGGQFGGAAGGNRQTFTRPSQRRARHFAECPGGTHHNGRLSAHIEQVGRIDLGKCHGRGSGCGMTTSIVATALPSLRIARPSPPGMWQLSRARS
jgi:hypothetical protein